MQFESPILYSSMEEPKKLPEVLTSSEACEEWLLAPPSDPKIIEYPAIERFRRELEKVVRPSNSYEGFRVWAENNLPIDLESPQQTQWPFSASELYFLENIISKEELPILEGLPLREVYYNLRLLFLKNRDKISNDFKILSVFGYPVVIVMKKEDWTKERWGLYCSSVGYIAIKGVNLDDLDELRIGIIHELTLAFSKYPGRGLYNLSRIYNTKIGDDFYYSPSDLYNKKDREEVRENYKKRVMITFREEVECYFHAGFNELGNSLKNFLEIINQQDFNYDFAQVDDFNRDPEEFKTGNFTDSLKRISLTEIKKYDPEFGDELDKTLRFWKLVLENSSPEKMDKIIRFIQNVNSFDEISIKNLEEIRKGCGISSFDVV